MSDYDFNLTPEGAAALKAIEALDGVTIKVGWQSGGGMKTASGEAQPKMASRRKLVARSYRHQLLLLKSHCITNSVRPQFLHAPS